MISNQEFRDMALSFPGSEEYPHFNRAAFKIIKKRVFATLHEPSRSANLKLTLNDQSVFCDFSDAVFPVANKWGLQGWTTFELNGMPKELMLNALESAYHHALTPGK